MCALGSSKGNVVGIKIALRKLDKKVKVVISSKLPPSLLVTTAAAVAHGHIAQDKESSLSMKNINSP